MITKGDPLKLKCTMCERPGLPTLQRMSCTGMDGCSMTITPADRVVEESEVDGYPLVITCQPRLGGARPVRLLYAERMVGAGSSPFLKLMPLFGAKATSVPRQDR